MDTRPRRTYCVRISDKGRLTVPADVRQAAGIPDGAELVVTASGDGEVTLTTRDAVIRRIRDAVPPAPAGGWPLAEWDREDAADDEQDDARDGAA
ncbi:AbrB/MazE/SpoVT family DNA-binding domain-containing protein [Sphaerimonospora cavernae]|uniref:AbrB/MazE/SpoVT family DNA-binding domain-containing protein n=1 Tax=Sphaerimonospora cavernae TaxID=1740611 RepID=A0ABV6UBD1_9ACTN